MTSSSSLYDVFVSYNHRDYDFVHNYLVPMLYSWDLKVMVDVKEFMLGKELNDNMEIRLQQSKKVIFVTSKHFMASKPCQFEVQESQKHKDKESLVTLALDGHSNVPTSLQSAAYCDLTQEPGNEDKWKQICAGVNGQWSDESNQILQGIQDLYSFFGGFLLNNTPTVLINRSHPMTHDAWNDGEGNPIKNPHAVDPPTVEAFLPILLMFGQIGKIRNVKFILTNSYGEYTEELPKGNDSANFIGIGGSGGDQLVKEFANKEVRWKNDFYGAMYQFQLDGEEYYNFDWEHQDDYLIYKSPMKVGNNIIYLFSPSGEGVNEACQQLLADYRKLAIRIKGQGFLRVHRRTGEVFEHLYKD